MGRLVVGKVCSRYWGSLLLDDYIEEEKKKKKKKKKKGEKRKALVTAIRMKKEVWLYNMT